MSKNTSKMEVKQSFCNYAMQFLTISLPSEN